MFAAIRNGTRFLYFQNPFWRLLTNTLSDGDVKDDLWAALRMACVELRLGLSARAFSTTDEPAVILQAVQFTPAAPWQILDALAVFGCLYRTQILGALARRAGAIEEFLYGLLAGMSLVIRRCRSMPYLQPSPDGLEVVLPTEFLTDSEGMAHRRR